MRIQLGLVAVLLTTACVPASNQGPAVKNDDKPTHEVDLAPVAKRSFLIAASSGDDSLTVFTRDLKTGALVQKSRVLQASLGMTGPQSILASRDGKFVVVGGSVLASFSVGEGGELVRLSTYTPPITGITHLTRYSPDDPSKDYFLLASFGGDRVGVVSLDTKTGMLTGQASSWQGVPAGSHPHSFVMNHDGKFAYAALAGSTTALTPGNVIATFTFNSSTLALGSPSYSPVNRDVASQNTQPRFPRMVVFHPTLDVLYLLNERQPALFAFDANRTTGAITKRDETRLGAGTANEDQWSAGLTFQGDGRFAYATNRNFSTVTSYEVATNGDLTVLQAGVATTLASPTNGKVPWFTKLAPHGDFLYTANANTTPTNSNVGITNAGGVSVFAVGSDGRVQLKSVVPSQGTFTRFFEIIDQY